MFRLNLIKILQKSGFRVFAIAPEDKYSIKLKMQGIEYIPVHIDNKGTNPNNDFKLVYDLYNIYKNISPDVILHFTIKPNIYGSIAARILKIPVINNITGLGTVFLNDNILQSITTFLYKLAFSKVEKVFFQNNDDKNLFIQKKIIDKNKVDLLPGSGVDTKKFCPQNKTRTTSDVVFLLVARIIRDKGILEYVEAAKKVKNKYNHVEFQILGQLGSINKGAIKKGEVKLWQKKQIVNYLGEKDDVRESIANADCIVLPSYREGTSKILLEAASMAKPIITTDVPGCNNVVSDGENGFLCKPKDNIGLANKMEKMLRLSVLERKEMGLKGRKKMIDLFEEKIVITKYINSIESIVRN